MQACLAVPEGRCAWCALSVELQDSGLCQQCSRLSMLEDFDDAEACPAQALDVVMSAAWEIPPPRVGASVFGNSALSQSLGRSLRRDCWALSPQEKAASAFAGQGQSRCEWCRGCGWHSDGCPRASHSDVRFVDGLDDIQSSADVADVTMLQSPPRGWQAEKHLLFSPQGMGAPMAMSPSPAGRGLGGWMRQEMPERHSSPPPRQRRSHGATPCTPTKPQWQTHCENSCARCPVPCSFELSQKKGEDRLIIDCLGGGPQDVVWGVFDGHKGHDVAGHAARKFAGLVWASPHWPSSPEEALRSSLRQCNESAREEELRGGSTAVVVATNGTTVWCASAGDSHVVCGLRSGGVRRLSMDHTTLNPEEIHRIQASGGRIEWGRLGDLPMTRGLGNFGLEADGFLCAPEVTSIPRREIDFVVVASDGLWDVMEDEAVIERVRSLSGFGVRPNVSVDHIAQNLVTEARRLKSEDDIAAIVVFFPALPEQVTEGAGAKVNGSCDSIANHALAQENQVVHAAPGGA